MSESRLQHTEIPLYANPETLCCDTRGYVTIEPAGEPHRSLMQLQFNMKVKGLRLYELSPDEAHLIGSALVEHAIECGYEEEC